MKLEPNQTIENRYRIIERLGEGGMGEVWKALDTKLDDEVVIKMPLNHLDSEIIKRFGHEAKTMRKHSLDCPHILNIEDIGMIGEVPWYVMRFLPGGSARSQTIDVNGIDDIQWDSDSFEWLRQISSALDYLHKRKTFHRDVKPENILFSGEGTPYLVDFGIVKNATETTTMMTQHGQAIGTMAYMAPEILDGGKFTPQSDQYALAVTLYEVITGDRPFGGTTYFSLFKSLQEGHQKLKLRFPTIPQSASDAIDQSLSASPDNRFDSCSDFADQFIAGLRGTAKAKVPAIDRPVAVEPVVAHPPTHEGDKPKDNSLVTEGEVASKPALFQPPVRPKKPNPKEMPILSKHRYGWMLGFLSAVAVVSTVLGFLLIDQIIAFLELNVEDETFLAVYCGTKAFQGLIWAQPCLIATWFCASRLRWWVKLCIACLSLIFLQTLHSLLLSFPLVDFETSIAEFTGDTVVMSISFSLMFFAASIIASRPKFLAFGQTKWLIFLAFAAVALHYYVAVSFMEGPNAVTSTVESLDVGSDKAAEVYFRSLEFTTMLLAYFLILPILSKLSQLWKPLLAVTCFALISSALTGYMDYVHYFEPEESLQFIWLASLSRVSAFLAVAISGLFLMRQLGYRLASASSKVALSFKA